MAIVTMSTQQFEIEIAKSVGWRGIEDRTGHGHYVGVAPGGLRYPVPSSTSDLRVAWSLLEHCTRLGGFAQRGVFELLHANQLFSMHSSDAALLVCLAFYKWRTGDDVHILDEEDCEE